jgi:cytochrome P450
LPPTYSDTTASTLTYLFYHLAHDSTQQEKIWLELASLREEDGEISFKSLQGADHLNGTINEALRLHPALPSSVLRLTPPEGIKIGETLIPRNTTVVVPSYTVGRRKHLVDEDAILVNRFADFSSVESCYEKAHAFIPERWYANDKMIKNKNAFAPFSLGKSPFEHRLYKQLTVARRRALFLCGQAAGIDGVTYGCSASGNGI